MAERFVSPGIGENMIRYLERTYGNGNAHVTHKTIVHFGNDDIQPPVRQNGRTCKVCGAIFVPVTRQSHSFLCPCCRDKRDTAAYEAKKAHLRADERAERIRERAEG